MNSSAFRQTNKAVHPRARGEHYSFAPIPEGMTGSSPRSRGTCFLVYGQGLDSRFIPALAGNILSQPGGSECRPVHPRARGEHAVRHDSHAGRSGSSPRSRGTSSRGVFRRVFVRFIPALAGNIDDNGFQGPRDAVHPRARGEHLSPEVAKRALAGSSPRSRGTCPSAGWTGIEGRFIPALAGNNRRRGLG